MQRRQSHVQKPLDSQRTDKESAVGKVESRNDRRERSLSPQVVQGKVALERSLLRDRDDEISRLKDQIRSFARSTRYSAEKRLTEENGKLKRDVAQLQDALKTRYEGGKSEEPTWRAGAFAKPGPTSSSVSVAAAVAAATRCDIEAPANGVTRNASAVAVTEVAGKVQGDEANTRKDVSHSREASGQIYRQASTVVERHREPAAIVTATNGRVRESRLSKSPPRTSSPRATAALASQVMQLHRQLKERDEDARGVEERLRSEMALLEARNEQLESVQERVAQQPHVDALSADALLAERADEEQLRAMSKFGEQAAEREQWRQEREVLLNEQRRREKELELLKRQLGSVQERLDSTQLSATDLQERRQSMKAKALSEKSKGESAGKEAELLQKNSALESQVHSQQLELNRLRHQMHRLETAENARSATLPPREDRGGGRGRGRGPTVRPRPVSSVGLGARRGGVPAGRGANLSASVPTLPSSVGLHSSKAPAGTLPLHRLRPAEPCLSQSLLPRSPSSSSCSSLCSESSMGSSSVATESHKRGNPQLCAVFGDAPLQKIPDVGWYFRLRINSVSTGWIGGFGIGVTLSTPCSLAVLPDRASRVPRSWLAGYWGRTFSNGSERLSEWKPQDLVPNDEVGFLVTTEGACIVYINDMERCRFGNPPVPVKPGMCAEGEPELIALIDVTRVCTNEPTYTLLPGALPPAAVGAVMCRGSPNTSPPSSSSATLGAAGAAMVLGAEVGPSPPPPSRTASPPSRAPSPPLRLLPPTVNPPRLGGSLPLPGPPMPLRQGGISSPPAPVLPLRQGLGGAPQPSLGSSQMAVADNTRSVAAAAAARRVPKLSLQNVSCD